MQIKSLAGELIRRPLISERFVSLTEESLAERASGLTQEPIPLCTLGEVLTDIWEEVLEGGKATGVFTAGTVSGC